MRLSPRFRGRLGRRGFLIRIFAISAGVLGLTLLLAVFATIAVRTTSVSPVDAARVLDRTSTLLWIAIAPWMAGVFVRRLHDLDWPGWLAVAPVASAIVGAAEGWLEGGGGRTTPYLAVPEPAGLALLALQVSAMVLTIAGMVLPGRGENRHGPRAEPAASDRSAFPLPDRTVFDAGEPPGDRGA